MKTLSQQLSDLSRRAKKVEEDFAIAKKETREMLESRREAIQGNIHSGLEELHQKAERSKSIISSSVSSLKDKIKLDFERARQRVAKGAAKIEANIVADRASDYEDDAALAIAYAASAIDDAEMAVLDAIAARAEAEKLAR